MRVQRGLRPNVLIIVFFFTVVLAGACGVHEHAAPKDTPALGAQMAASRPMDVVFDQGGVVHLKLVDQSQPLRAAYPAYAYAIAQAKAVSAPEQDIAQLIFAQAELPASVDEQLLDSITPSPWLWAPVPRYYDVRADGTLAWPQARRQRMIAAYAKWAGVDQAVDQILAAMPPATRTILDAYAQGKRDWFRATRAYYAMLLPQYEQAGVLDWMINHLSARSIVYRIVYDQQLYMSAAIAGSVSAAGQVSIGASNAMALAPGFAEHVLAYGAPHLGNARSPFPAFALHHGGKTLLGMFSQSAVPEIWAGNSSFNFMTASPNVKHKSEVRFIDYANKVFEETEVAKGRFAPLVPRTFDVAIGGVVTTHTTYEANDGTLVARAQPSSGGEIGFFVNRMPDPLQYTDQVSNLLFSADEGDEATYVAQDARTERPYWDRVSGMTGASALGGRVDFALETGKMVRYADPMMGIIGFILPYWGSQITGVLSQAELPRVQGVRSIAAAHNSSAKASILRPSVLANVPNYADPGGTTTRTEASMQRFGQRAEAYETHLDLGGTPQNYPGARIKSSEFIDFVTTPYSLHYTRLAQLLSQLDLAWPNLSGLSAAQRLRIRQLLVNFTVWDGVVRRDDPWGVVAYLVAQEMQQVLATQSSSLTELVRKVLLSDPTIDISQAVAAATQADALALLTGTDNAIATYLHVCAPAGRTLVKDVFVARVAGNVVASMTATSASMYSANYQPVAGEVCQYEPVSMSPFDVVYDPNPAQPMAYLHIFGSPLTQHTGLENTVRAFWANKLNQDGLARYEPYPLNGQLPPPTKHLLPRFRILVP